jgi:uncharacterized membrane protein YuzA (DUF378 family)
MKGLHKITFILLIIGGLNWLLVGLFNWDISQLFGGMSSGLARVIYILVGLSALVELFSHKKTCKYCDKGATPSSSAPSGSAMNM